jgi:hypothetical protein
LKVAKQKGVCGSRPDNWGHIRTKDCGFTNVKRGEAKMNITAVTMVQLEDFLETIASKYTRKNYVNGIKKFEE